MKKWVALLKKFLDSFRMWRGRDQLSNIIKSRTELLQVFDSLTDPVVIIDKELKIQRVNKATLSALTKTSFDEFIGKPCYQVLHGLNQRCPECTAPITLVSGERTSRTGLLGARSNPTEVTYGITCYPLKNRRGQTVGIAEYYRDVTETMNLTRELYESERARTMEPLAVGLAHQIRQPLTIIRSAAQYVLEVFQKALKEPDFKETMDTIVQNADTINDVLSELLHFSKPNQYQMKKGSLAKILEGSLKLMKHRLKEQKIQVVTDWPKEPPEILMDEKLFLQACLNLLSNSIDSMPQGGQLTLQVSCPKDGGKNRICVVIEDTGKGVPKELIPKLFRPFFTTKEGGVGLGLSIAEGIIRSHGGETRFESREDRGTRVVIELPVTLG